MFKKAKCICCGEEQEKIKLFPLISKKLSKVVCQKCVNSVHIVNVSAEYPEKVHVRDCDAEVEYEVRDFFEKYKGKIIFMNYPGTVMKDGRLNLKEDYDVIAVEEVYFLHSIDNIENFSLYVKLLVSEGYFNASEEEQKSAEFIENILKKQVDSLPDTL